MDDGVSWVWLRMMARGDSNVFADYAEAGY